MVEYLDPEIANEGSSANNWSPGAWTNAQTIADDEFQPDIEPPHIPDYAMFKKHKTYAKYFRPYRYQPFPAWLYHPTHEPRLIAKFDVRDGKIDVDACTQEVLALGPEWSPTPLKPRIDMTGKSLPVKTDTQRLTEALVAGMATNPKGGAVDPAAIAAIIAATMAALQQQSAPQPEALAVDEGTERAALIEMAEKDGKKIDKRWSNQRLKEELGL